MNVTKLSMAKLSVTALTALTLMACGKQTVSFDTLETARTQAKSNAEYNAQKFRSDSVIYTNFAIEMQGDSTQVATCPQGDGWASGQLVDKSNTANRIKVKCSTVSGAVGCLLQTDFDKKPYASEDGRCQDETKVPFPLPKLFR